MKMINYIKNLFSKPLPNTAIHPDYNEEKNRIDEYFDNISADELYDISKTKYGFNDANVNNERFCVFREGSVLIFTQEDVIKLYDLCDKQKNEIIDLKNRFREDSK